MGKYIGGVISNGGPVSYSNYFKGSNNLSTASNAALALGTGDFTIEFWVNLPAYSSNRVLSWGTTSAPIIYFSSGYLYYDSYGSSNVAQSTIIAPIGAWTHCAISRSSGTTKIFINGTQGASVSDTNNWSGQSGIYIGVDVSTTYLTGSLSNLRIVKGTALYTSNFIPPTGPLKNITNTLLLTCQSSTIVDNSPYNWAITNTGSVDVSSYTPFRAYNPDENNPALGAATNQTITLNDAAYYSQRRLSNAYDPSFYTTVLSLSANGSNTANNHSFTDASTNNFSITRNGNTTQGTFNPYRTNGYWGMGTSGSYVTTSNQLGRLGTSNFTVEGWFYLTQAIGGTNTNLWGEDNGSGTNPKLMLWLTSTSIVFHTGNIASDVITAAHNGFSLNKWHHIALVRRSTAANGCTLYLDGVALNTTSAALGSLSASTASFNIGYVGEAYGDAFNGFISNFRITNTAVYSGSSLTIPTEPLSAISGTQLLTCQSNRFVDNSASPFTLTPSSSSTVIKSFNPFPQNLPYDSKRHGGSGYFDGSGDYLNVASSAAFALPDAFTFECWVYRTGSGASQCVYLTNVNDGFIVYTSSNKVVVRNFNGSDLITSSSDLQYNQWTHIAVSRSGTTMSLWLNGSRTAGGTATNSTSFAQGAVIVGTNETNSIPLGGYVCDLRLVKGTAVYDPTQTTITVPTAPLTAITNSSLLLNFTNAGIYDSSMMSNLETLGDAQVSAGTFKYGSGSLKFDGTGDSLYLPASPNWALGDSITIEGWFYFNSINAGTGGALVSTYDYYSSTEFGWFLVLNSTAKIQFACFGNGGSYGGNHNAINITGATTITTGQWYHIAFVKNGINGQIYINGMSDVSGTFSETNTESRQLGIGMSFTGNGTKTFYIPSSYIDDLRITNGVARYTGNFQPPTSQLQTM